LPIYQLDKKEKFQSVSLHQRVIQTRSSQRILDGPQSGLSPDVDQGRHGEARDLLAPVYGRFTEGFDTLDLKEREGAVGRAAG
jgi:hypothetical protein